MSRRRFPAEAVRGTAMHQIRWNRLVVAGLAAGAVLLAGQTILSSYILGIEWQQTLLKLRAAPTSSGDAVMLVFATILLGVFQAWLIARLRRTPAIPMPRVVLEAAFIVWFTAFAFTGTWLMLLGILPARLMAFGNLWGLGECVLSSLVAAWIYARGGS